MRTVVAAVLLNMALAGSSDAQFRTYPKEDPSDLRAGESKTLKAETLPGGDFAFNFEGSYDVSVQVLQLFLTPDIDGWNWYIPLLIATAPDTDPDNEAPVSLARSLSGEGKAALSVITGYAKEWRGTTTVETPDGPEQRKSLTGVWLESGLQYKAHAVTAVSENSATTKIGHAGGAFAAFQAQVTVSAKPRIESLENLTGVAYVRLYAAASHWLHEPANLSLIFGGQAPHSWFGAFQASAGIFFMNGGAIEMSISRAIGTGLSGPAGSDFDLEDTVAQAGLRFVPAKLLGR